MSLVNDVYVLQFDHAGYEEALQKSRDYIVTFSRKLLNVKRSAIDSNISSSSPFATMILPISDIYSKILFQYLSALFLVVVSR